LESEIKESKNLADFSKTFEEFRLTISTMKKEPIMNKKVASKHRVGLQILQPKKQKAL
jgi:hypothetical protein